MATKPKLRLLSTKILRAGLYARFSTELQLRTSIDDQLVACRAHAERLGAKVVATFKDEAKSGTTIFERFGLHDLMKAVATDEIDIIIAESFSRLARHPVEGPAILERAQYHGVRISTILDGEANELNVGFRSISDSQMVKQTALQVKRAQAARILNGLVPGSVSYGYDAVPGKPGERVINKAEARVLNRWFEEYAAGSSPKTIAMGLNSDGIAAPGGGKWNYATFTGGRGRRGMLGNRLYKGELVWDQSSQKRNPDTGKLVKRTTPENEWKIVKVPHLQIINTELWDAANAVRKARSVKRCSTSGRRKVIPRKDYLLAGLLYCGTCQGHMRVSNTSRNGTARVACAAAHEQGTCKHSKTYDLGRLEAGIINRMREQLANPDSIIEIARAYHAEHAQLMATFRRENDGLEKQIGRIEIKQRNLTEAIEDATSVGVIKRLAEQLDTLEAERVALIERRDQLGQPSVVEMHPTAIKQYRANIEQLHASFQSFGRTPVNRAAFRNLVERIVVVPTPKRMPYEWRLRGRLAAILGMNLFPATRTTQEIVAAEGRGRANPYYDNSDTGNPGAPLSQHADVVDLGSFREAA